MVLERTQDEILIKLPADFDVTELQNMLDYLKYKELSSKSSASEKDADELSKKVNKSMTAKAKAKRG